MNTELLIIRFRTAVEDATSAHRARMPGRAQSDLTHAHDILAELRRRWSDGENIELRPLAALAHDADELIYPLP